MSFVCAFPALLVTADLVHLFCVTEVSIISQKAVRKQNKPAFPQRARVEV